METLWEICASPRSFRTVFILFSDIPEMPVAVMLVILQLYCYVNLIL